MSKFIKLIVSESNTETCVNINQIIRFSKYRDNLEKSIIQFTGSGHIEDQNYIVVDHSFDELLILIGGKQ